NAQSVLGRPIEEPAWRHGERPQGVGAQLGHQPEVGLEHVLRREREAVARSPEGAVRDSTYVDLVIANEEELPADRDGRTIERGSGSPLWERAKHCLAHMGRRKGGK